MSRLTLYKDNCTDATIVSNRFIDEYMKDANDAQIKIYLYLIRMMSANLPTSISDIADKFNHTEKDVVRALSYWEKQNLVKLDYDESGEICALHLQSPQSNSVNKSRNASIDTAQIKESARIVTLPGISDSEMKKSGMSKTSSQSLQTTTENATSYTKPAYSLDDISIFKKNEESSQIIFIAETYLGRTLSATDMKSLIFINKELKFSTELIDYLIEYCVGKGKREMRYIEKVAVNWASENVTSVRQAKNRSTRYDKLVYTVMKALGRGSEPTTQEAAFIQRWNKEYGFSMEVILTACDKAVLAVDSHRFEYTEGILSKWHKAGVHTPGEIQKAQDAFVKSKSNATNATNKPVNNFNDFNQRKYDYDALEKELLSN